VTPLKQLQICLAATTAFSTLLAMALVNVNVELARLVLYTGMAVGIADGIASRHYGAD
jgi:hypothetical protein